MGDAQCHFTGLLQDVHAIIATTRAITGKTSMTTIADLVAPKASLGQRYAEH